MNKSVFLLTTSIIRYIILVVRKRSNGTTLWKIMVHGRTSDIRKMDC